MKISESRVDYQSEGPMYHSANTGEIEKIQNNLWTLYAYHKSLSEIKDEFESILKLNGGKAQSYFYEKQVRLT